MTTPATKRRKSTEESNAFKKNDRTTKSKPPKITAKLAAMAIQRPGCRLKNLQPSAIQVQPWLVGTGCPSAMKFCCAAMADPPGYFSFNLTRTVAIALATSEPSSFFASPSTKIMLRPFFSTRASASSRAPLPPRSEEHTSELQSQSNLVCRLLLENKKHYDATPM